MQESRYLRSTIKAYTICGQIRLGATDYLSCFLDSEVQDLEFGFEKVENKIDCNTHSFNIQTNKTSVATPTVLFVSTVSPFDYQHDHVSLSQSFEPHDQPRT